MRFLHDIAVSDGEPQAGVLERATDRQVFSRLEPVQKHLIPPPLLVVPERLNCIRGLHTLHLLDTSRKLC